MRPIRFRAWMPSQKKMFGTETLDIDQLTLMAGGNFINVSGVSTRMSIIYTDTEIIPLQSTGLRDLAGQEIYEGDILQINPKFGPQRRYVMTWGSVLHKVDLGWVLSNDNGTFNLMGIDAMDVVGNIYEHPELLLQTPPVNYTWEKPKNIIGNINLPDH